MLKPIVRMALLATVVLSGASASLTATSDAAAAPVATIRLKDIDEQLVPTEVVAGDREFGGNGPAIECTVTLTVTADQRSIFAVVDFRAKETKADWSETKGSWSRKVYTAPPGRKIDAIVDGSSSTVKFVSKPAGFQLLGPTEDFIKLLDSLKRVSEALLTFGNPVLAPAATSPAKQQMKQMAERVIKGTAYLKSEGNHVHLRAPTSGPVQLFAIVGDTGGPDISSDENPKDDTRISGIKFKPIKVRLK